MQILKMGSSIFMIGCANAQLYILLLQKKMMHQGEAEPEQYWTIGVDVDTDSSAVVERAPDKIQIRESE